MATIKFYNVKSRKSVEVDVSKVEKVTLKNGRSAAICLLLGPGTMPAVALLTPSVVPGPTERIVHAQHNVRVRDQSVIR